MNVSATLIPCPRCKAAMVTLNGTAQSLCTLWKRDGQPCVTPHEDDCPLRGREIPPWL